MDIIYCCWTGNNEMSQNRQLCLQQLENTSDCKVILITPNNLNDYIVPEYPLHAAYKYLSETHKADYLRTYLMHFHGGGYSDIKKTTGSWKKSFNDVKQSDYWICGYPEIEGGVGYAPHANKWKELIGNCAYICKPRTKLTTEWYNAMIALLDTKLDELKLHPAKHPQDQKCDRSKYPIRWIEMLGEIFHRVAYQYNDHVLNTLPISIFKEYR
jgi:hypothetical protein